MNKKAIILSGMRPTGDLHIGHYFGVLKNWIRLQDEYKCFYMVADLHALTTLDDTKNIKHDSIKTAALWIASGLDPKKSTIFVQSSVSEHSELAIILGMLSPIAMLERNPTYKEMQKEHPKFHTLGLLSYPVLQSADILLYKASYVPIGKDQEPHLELARELAKRFNHHFHGNYFIEPKALFEEIPKIMSLQDPFKKMSKSHKEDSYISLLDDSSAIHKKIAKAVTDSGSEIKYAPNKKPALANLITLYSLASEKPIKAVEKKFANKGYGEFKKELAEQIDKVIKPIREESQKLIKDSKKIQKILNDGSSEAKKVASKTLNEAKKAIGI